MALAPVPPCVGQGRAPAAYGSAGSSASSSGQRQGGEKLSEGRLHDMALGGGSQIRETVI